MLAPVWGWHPSTRSPTDRGHPSRSDTLVCSWAQGPATNRHPKRTVSEPGLTTSNWPLARFPKLPRCVGRMALPKFFNRAVEPLAGLVSGYDCGGRVWVAVSVCVVQLGREIASWVRQHHTHEGPV